MKNLHREIGTSLTALVFIVISITGILMYFHILDSYTKDLHEILGLAFVAVAILHVYVNFKPMKKYFSKKIFLASTALVVAVSLGFILNPKQGGGIKHQILDSVLESPISKSFSVLNIDTNTAMSKLKSAGIKIENANSIQSIAKENKISPLKVANIILK